jgi:hypothetical protein
MGEMSILEWTVAYIKYKDSVQRKIQSIEPNDKTASVTVKNKDGSEHKYLATNLLSTLNTSSLNEEKIACLNKKENVDWLLSNWDKLKDKKCVFLFVNTKKSENWAINPRMHSSITDKSALKPGLKALYDSITHSD